MNVNCNDRDRIFTDGTPEEWAALEAHAVACSACAEELRAWKSLSVVAAELRDYSGDPALWHRIRRSLVEQAVRRERGWNLGALFGNLQISWQAAAVSVFALL